MPKLMILYKAHIWPRYTNTNYQSGFDMSFQNQTVVRWLLGHTSAILYWNNFPECSCYLPVSLFWLSTQVKCICKTHGIFIISRLIKQETVVALSRNTPRRWDYHIINVSDDNTCSICLTSYFYMDSRFSLSCYYTFWLTFKDLEISFWVLFLRL